METPNIGELLGNKMPEKKKTTGGITSEKAEQATKLLFFMGDDKTLPEEYALERKEPGAGKEAKRKRISKRIQYWLGRTRGMTGSEVRDMMRKAKGGDNPHALFNHLLQAWKKQQSQSKASSRTSTPTSKRSTRRGGTGTQSSKKRQTESLWNAGSQEQNQSKKDTQST